MSVDEKEKKIIELAALIEEKNQPFMSKTREHKNVIGVIDDMIKNIDLKTIAVDFDFVSKRRKLNILNFIRKEISEDKMANEFGVFENIRQLKEELGLKTDE